MHSIRQLLRQPMKTLAGLLLVVMAVSVLCVCLGQALAAAVMEDNIDKSFTTVALPTNKYQFSSAIDESGLPVSVINRHLPADVAEWIEEMAEQHPEIIKSIHTPGFASAFSLGLSPVNMTDFYVESYAADSYYSSITGNSANTQVMLEITLERVSQVRYGMQVPGENWVELTGTIESVIGLEEGYADPTGFTARMYLVVPEGTSVHDFNLQNGRRYLVYGMDYLDLDWTLRNEITTSNEVPPAEEGLAPSTESLVIDRFNPEDLHYLYEDPCNNLEYYYERFYYDGVNSIWLNYSTEMYRHTNVAYYTFYQEMGDGTTTLRSTSLTLDELRRFRAVEFTIQDQSTSDGSYAMPTIQRLDGSAEEFLESEDGQIWKMILEQMEVNHHAFAVLGVRDLMALGEFALDNVHISAGRDFTDEEIEAGSRVCVISDELAARNGLELGDTISLQYYKTPEENPFQNRISDGYGVINPAAYFFLEGSEFTGEAEEYTIVGLYHKDLLWQATSSYYAFNCNTVFVPETSVTGEMEYADTGLFLSLILENGMDEEMAALSNQHGHGGFLLVADQGYEEVMSNLHDYQEVAVQAMIIGIAVYAIIFILYVILFPAQQSKTLTTMGGLGAPFSEKLKFMLGNSLGILVPGTVIGAVVSMLLWQQVVDVLMGSANVILTLELDIPMMIMIALAQLMAAAAVVCLCALPMARNRGLMNRQGVIKRFFSRLTKRRNKGVTVVFALIISLVLCGLQAANEQEIINYGISYQTTPVKVTLVSLHSNDAYNLNADGFTKDLFAEERFESFTPRRYLTDFQFMAEIPVDSINLEPYAGNLTGITSKVNPPNLSDERACVISWTDGYDSSCLDGEEMVLLVPDGFDPEDMDDETPGIQVQLNFSNLVPNGNAVDGSTTYRNETYECFATVAGSYINSIASQEIYCNYQAVARCASSVWMSYGLDHISAIMKNNDEIADLRAMADQWFADPDKELDVTQQYEYLLNIDDTALHRLATTLENSILINQGCTLLVFVLSAGAGFFLGFLMIRSRKREIILMRTLGKANFRILLEYFMEQMLCIALGTVVGGAYFRWQPVERLGVFVGIYALGLVIALVVFLNSKLLTTIKEDE